MTGDYQNGTGGTTASTPPAEGDYLETDAARVGGWGTEPPATSPEKINIDPSDREYHLQRVCSQFPKVISAERAARLARLLGGTAVG